MADSHDMAPALLLERLLVVIDEGRRTGTHKLLTLLALLDATAASVGNDLRPAPELPVRAVAEHVLEVAWPHVVPFARDGDAVVLRQMNDGRRNVVIEATADARGRADAIGVRSPQQLRRADAATYHRTVGTIERQLVRYPLALLQRIDENSPDFLFTSWPEGRSPAAVARHQDRSVPTIVWLPGTAEALLRFAALIRPLVELAFVRDVASWNALDTTEGHLRAHLFGVDRTAWAAGLKEELLAVQDRRCFYDPDGPRVRPEDLQIDHFLPWSRFHSDGTANLVLARSSTNASKSDLFGAPRHVRAWQAGLTDRAAVGQRLGLEDESHRTLALARAGYGHLPIGSPLWLQRVAGGAGREVERLTDDARAEIAVLLERHPPTVLAADDPGDWSD